MSNSDMTPRSAKGPRTKKESVDLQGHLAEVGSEVKERAGEAMTASMDMARDKIAAATDAAKDALSGAADKLQDQTKEKQQSGAEFVSKLARNIRDAARAFEKDIPIAARSIESAADYVDNTADKLRNGSVQDVLDGATDFARRQPAAFLGLTVLAGFAAVRFLKASGHSSDSNRKSSTSELRS
jgi:hypothetical protein